MKFVPITGQQIKRMSYFIVVPERCSFLCTALDESLKPEGITCIGVLTTLT
jgi:hypothetical protein